MPLYPTLPIPVGVPILGFVSLTMYRAAQRSAHLGASSESAAVAQAAHDVLAATTCPRPPRSTPTSKRRYDAIGPGHARNKGDRIGAEAARDFLASRAGDGWRNPDIHYTKTGRRRRVVAQARARRTWSRAWLGSLRPLFVPLEPQSGPYPLDVDRVGRGLRGGAPGRAAPPAPRTTPADQTATALFHNGSNAAMALGDAVVRYLAAHPQGILETARIFALMHSAPADSIICAWQQKRDVGFWRPFQAISGLYDDGNPGTTPQPGWAPLVPNPQLLRLPQRARGWDVPAGRGGAPRARRGDRAGAAFVGRGLRACTPTCRRSSSKPSTPASGEACTTARR